MVIFFATAALHAAEPTGLAALSDDELLTELARRDLTVLLEHAFEEHHTPPEQRDAIRATAALGKLAREGSKLPLAQRRAIVAQVVAGIRRVLPSMTDPRELARQADALMTNGAAAEVNTLEYWGPSTSTQAQLRPVAETAIALLDRTIELAAAQASKLADSANPNDANAMRRVESAENLGLVAQQSRALGAVLRRPRLRPGRSSPARRRQTQRSPFSSRSTPTAIRHARR